MSSREFMGQAQVEKIIDEQTQGRIFGVTFEKKDGSLRQMVCRKGVRVGVKGTGAGWGAGSLKPLRTVFDMKKAAFRTIPTDRVVSVKVRGVLYTA